NYQWSVTTGGTILSTFQNNATIYWSTSGSDTVSVIITDINGNNDTVQWIVTVHPGPDPFILTSFVSECADSLQGGTQGPDRKPCIGACDSTAIKYYTPLTSGSTYSWKIDGGTIINGAGTNQITVVWGNTGQGSLVLIETNQWGCVDSVVECITINESPEAKFLSPANVCVNTGVSFLDQSSPAGDIVSWYWDFGDGNVTTAQNPVHAFSSGGTYTVTLVVMTACHCRDTATAVITVDPAQGPEIECPTPVCADSCVSYSTPANCSSYLWTVTGGTLVSGQGTNTIEVCWSSGPVGTISLQVSGCSPNLCNIPTVVYIPILDDNLNINGPNPVCQFEIEKYCLPVYPGSIYNWSVNGGTILSGQNTQCIQVQWGAGPQGSVAVNVTNPLLGCQGSDSINVDILPEFFISTLNEEVCLDDTTMLFAWPGTGFTWYVTGGTIISGQGTSNVNVHWTSPGNQTVITVPAVSGTYCNDTVITNIKVRTIAPPDSIAGADSICPGKTYTYTAFSSIGGVVYEWDVLNGSPSSGSGNVINVTWDPNVPGPYCLSVRHRMINTPNCPSDWVTMCVDTLAAPVVAISGGNGCVNQITSYTATVIPDADYYWSVTPSSMGSVVNGQGTPLVDIQWNSTAGTATIQLRVKSCNTVVNTNLNVALQPEPTVNPTLSGPLCEGGSVTLNAGSWASYQWSTGATTNPITISSEGFYTVTVTDANGCTANSNVFVKEHPLPVASISSPDPLVHCIGSSYAVNLFALESSGYSYSWSNGSTTSSTVVSSPGTYCVTVSNSYGCTEVDCITVSEVTCSGGCPNCPPSCQTNGNINFTWNIYSNNCEQIEFINSSSGGFNFNWNFGDGNTRWDYLN
ncbi:MAG: PKD domain-containing protein, partial [Chloroflexi bacterium]